MKKFDRKVKSLVISNELILSWLQTASSSIVIPDDSLIIDIEYRSWNNTSLFYIHSDEFEPIVECGEVERISLSKTEDNDG